MYINLHGTFNPLLHSSSHLYPSLSLSLISPSYTLQGRTVHPVHHRTFSAPLLWDDSKIYWITAILRRLCGPLRLRAWNLRLEWYGAQFPLPWKVRHSMESRWYVRTFAVCPYIRSVHIHTKVPFDYYTLENKLLISHLLWWKFGEPTCFRLSVFFQFFRHLFICFIYLFFWFIFSFAIYLLIFFIFWIFFLLNSIPHCNNPT